MAQHVLAGNTARATSWTRAGLAFACVIVFFAGTQRASALGVRSDSEQTSSPAGWQVRATYAPEITPFTRLSCVSTTTCEAISQSGSIAFRTTDGGVSWISQVFNQTGVGADAVSCASTTLCEIATYGTLYTTDDGGTSWAQETLPSGSNTNLLSVSCAPSTETCVAASSSGLDYTSTAGHSSPVWKAGSVPTGTGSLESVTCISSSKCLAVGTITSTSTSGAVLQTTDGGATWTTQFVDSASFDPLSQVVCPSSGECLAAAADGWVETTDESSASPTWSSEDGPMSQQLSQISCPTTTECYAAVFNDIYATSNATSLDATWDESSLPSDVNVTDAVACLSVSSCIAAGETNADPSGPFVLTTTNATAVTAPTWTNATLPTTLGEVDDISCATPSSCVAVGHATETGPIRILKTVNAGATWTPETNVPAITGEQSLDSVVCPSTTVCFAVGYAAGTPLILATSNGGASWAQQATPASITAGQLLSVSCASTLDCVGAGYVASSDSDALSGLVLTTTNGGVGASGWTERTLPGTNGPVESIACKSKTSCVAVGLQQYQAGGEVFYTGNGGATWSAGTVPKTTQPLGLLGIACLSTTTCEAVGYQGEDAFEGTAVATRTTDGGKIWSGPATVPSSASGFVAISCPSVQVCDAVGPAGSSGADATITTDAGAKWSVQPFAALSGAVLQAITCPLTNYCLAGGTGSSGAGMLASYVPATLAVTTTSLKAGKVGKSYSFQLKATGGAGSYTWSRSGGSLPSGLTLSASGLISGKPKAKKSESITFEVKDQLSHSATKVLKLTIS